MSKLIMVLPATFWQIPIVNKIKKNGAQGFACEPL